MVLKHAFSREALYKAAFCFEHGCGKEIFVNYKKGETNEKNKCFGDFAIV